jgi:hypothetical protein
VHLFLVVGGGRVPAVSHLDGALSRAAAPIPALGDADRWSFRSARAGLVAPGLHHAGSRCAPRRYRHVASNGWVTAYDGFPLLEGGGEPWDAATLAAHWERLPEVLERACCALQLRPDGGEAELVTDPVGMLPVYHAGLVRR